MDIVDIAISQIGTSESNGGDMKFINWYGGFGPGTAWCAIFVSWCANQAGISTSVIPKYSYCPSGMQWFKSHGNFQPRGSYIPKRGDIIFYCTNYSHTGIVEKVTGSTLHTIEGNTTGDAVARKTHPLSFKTITGYGVPKYSGSGAISNPGNSNTGTGSSATDNSKTDQSEAERKAKAAEEKKYLEMILNRKAAPIPDMKGKIKDDAGPADVELRIIINNWKKEFEPPILEDVQLSLERIGTPGKLTFKAIPDAKYPIDEGNAVLMIVDKKKIFYGFIFSRSSDRDGILSITAYDQIRYLKNQDTILYKNLTADQLIRKVAKDFKLQVGDLAKTGYAMSRSEENQTLLDVIQNALDETTFMKGETYVLYDKVGKLTLKKIGDLRSNFVVCPDTAENYDYQTSIDSDVYNRIKLTYTHEKGKKSEEESAEKVRDIYILQDQNHINQWGMLQYVDTIDDPGLWGLKSKALLQLYNQKKKNITITGVFGSTSIIAGSLLPVFLDLGDTKISNYMLVEKVTHKFKNRVHNMDLTLAGGDFVG